MNTFSPTSDTSVQQRLAYARKYIAQLKSNPNSDAAMKAIYDLCLPGGYDGPIKHLIKANPTLLPLRSVAIALCRAANEHVERLGHIEVLYRHGFRGAEFYAEYARMLNQSGNYERCLKICQEALLQYPNVTDLILLRGQVYITLSRHAEALKDAAWVASHAPRNSPEASRARTTVGMIKLLLSDGKEGYEDYAAQRDEEIARHGFKITLPEWRGESLAGKHLMVWCSQGIGDIIMFGSLLPWVLAQGARVTLALYPKMIPIFSRSFPGIRIIPHTRDMFERYGRECDFQTVFGQLMPYVLPHYTPAQHPPYLKADALRIRTLREKYLAIRKPRKLVGISWHTTNPDTFSQRNISLELWRPLFELPHIQFVSLQYGNHAAEINAINRALPGALLVDPDIDAYGDTEGLAAQIAAMDEVVSIQNSTVHLAGALGVKTTLMLSTASDWRWGLNGTNNRWYANVHIERQKTLLEWQPVLARVRDRLMT